MAAADSNTLCHLEYIYGIVSIFFIYLLCNSARSSSAAGNIDGGFSVELIHRNSPNSPFYNPNETTPTSSNKANVRRLMEPNTPEYEIRRNRDDNEGSLLMKLSIGTPPFEIYVVADTGSTLLWTQCEPCVSCFIQKHPKFDPTKSSTYTKLSCDAQECNIKNEAGTYSCSPDDQELCNYNYTYMDESMTQGVLGKDTITLTSTSGSEEPTTKSLKNIVFGCGYNNSGVFSENEMGVAGLGVGKMSLISQMGPYVGGRKFSQCLVPFDDHHPSSGSAGKMRFGKGSEVLGEGVVSTPLVSKDGRNQYFVTVDGISVADKFVPYYNKSYQDEFLIPKGNMCLDSGTQITMLPQEFYDRLISQVKKTINSMLKLEPVELEYPKQETPVCYDTTRNDLKGGPTLTVYFEGGAKVQLTPTQTFIRHQDDDKLLCFAMQNQSNSDDDAGGIYGNYLHSNFLIGFDLEKMQVSFKQTECAKSTSTSTSTADIATTPFSYFFTYFLNILLIANLCY